MPSGDRDEYVDAVVAVHRDRSRSRSGSRPTSPGAAAASTSGRKLGAASDDHYGVVDSDTSFAPAAAGGVADRSEQQMRRAGDARRDLSYGRDAPEGERRHHQRRPVSGGVPAGGGHGSVSDRAFRLAEAAIDRVDSQLARLGIATSSGGGRRGDAPTDSDEDVRARSGPTPTPQHRGYGSSRTAGGRRRDPRHADAAAAAAVETSDAAVDTSVEQPDPHVTVEELEGIVVPIRDALREVLDAVAVHEDLLAVGRGEATTATVERCIERAVERMAATGQLAALLGGSNDWSPTPYTGGGLSSYDAASPPVGSSSSGGSSLRATRKALRDEIAAEREQRKTEIDTLQAILDDTISRVRSLEAATASLEDAAARRPSALSSTGRAYGDAAGASRRLHSDDVDLVRRLIADAEPLILSRAETAVQPAINHVRQLAVATQHSADTAAERALAAVSADIAQLRDVTRRLSRDLDDRTGSLRTDTQKAVAEIARGCQVPCPVV